MRRNMDVPTMAKRTTFACIAWSSGQLFAKHTNTCWTAARRSATPATMSSPGLIRENNISTQTVTTTPIADARQSHSVSSTFVSAETWRSQRGTPTQIMIAKVELAPKFLMVLMTNQAEAKRYAPPIPVNARIDAADLNVA